MKKAIFIFISLLILLPACKQRMYTMEEDGGATVKCYIKNMESNGENIDTIESILTQRLQHIDKRIIPLIEYDDKDSIYTIQIPGVQQMDGELLLSYGRICIEEMYTKQEIIPFLNRDSLMNEELETYAFSQTSALLEGVEPKKISMFNKIFDSEEMRSSLPSDSYLIWQEDKNLDYANLFVVKKNKRGIDVNKFFVSSEVEQSMYGNSYEMGITLSKEGATRFEKLTQTNIGRPLAFMLDDKLLMAPMVQSKIEGGRMSITGNFTKEELIIINSVLYSPVIKSDIEIIKADKNKVKK
jgi:hypothetical protein